MSKPAVTGREMTDLAVDGLQLVFQLMLAVEGRDVFALIFFILSSSLTSMLLERMFSLECMVVLNAYADFGRELEL